jgi:hypothetical protein
MGTGFFSQEFSILIEENFFMYFIFIDAHIKSDDPFGIYFEYFINRISLEILRNIFQNGFLELSRLQFRFGLGENNRAEKSNKKYQQYLFHKSLVPRLKNLMAQRLEAFLLEFCSRGN